jgi:hypothetical protein
MPNPAPTGPESPPLGSRSAAICAAIPGPTARGGGDTTALAPYHPPWAPFSPAHHRELGKLPRTAPDGLMLQLGGTRTDRGCPWMTAVDRCLGHVRARPVRLNMARAWRRWHHLGGRVWSVLGDACLVGKGRWPAAAVGVRGSNPALCCLAVPGGSGEGCVTCGCCALVVTAGARRGPGVSGGVRTRRGPGRPRSRAGSGPSGARAPAALGAPRPRTGSVWRARLAVSGLGGLGGRPLVRLGGLLGAG